DGHLRKSFDIGLEYGTDIEATLSIILDAVNTTPGILQEERSATTLIKNLGANKINIQGQYWVNTINKQYTTEEINSRAIKKTLNALESAQINLP
ncbi:MAG TPA: mechanosensitive ion channel protein MscS, partial [Saprospirales bacterium]|nr:mechanosensitive ion channel protein MscS [Saprospirales bacterium]